MPFRPARGERQPRVFAVQGLNSRLFIDAEHRRVRRRVQIQTNDVGRLLLKVRIVRGHTKKRPLKITTPMMVIANQTVVCISAEVTSIVGIGLKELT
jgi:hypothetical protein